jgi:dTDP-4-dehydrorhamnose 3,5-epimerase
VINYLCSEEYSPATEHQINPKDPDLAIDFEGFGSNLGISGFVLSEQDENAQSLNDALAAGSLPAFRS